MGHSYERDGDAHRKILTITCTILLKKTNLGVARVFPERYVLVPDRSNRQNSIVITISGGKLTMMG